MYPRLEDIRDISAQIAVAVATAAGEEGRLRGRLRDKWAQGPDPMLRYIQQSMFVPTYSPLVHLQRGVEE